MFSWSVDIIVMLILIILMWVVIGQSVDSIVKDQESHTNRVVSKYADVSSAFVMVQSDNIPEDIKVAILARMVRLKIIKCAHTIFTVYV